MIHLHIQLRDLATLLLGEGPDADFNFFRYLVPQYPKPVFWNPYNVILAEPYGLC